MEAQSALVWSNGRVEFDTETAVDLYGTIIAKPWNAEHDYSFGLNDSFHHFVLTIERFLFDAGFQRFDDFQYCLMEFRGVWVTLLYQRQISFTKPDIIHLLIFFFAGSFCASCDKRLGEINIFAVS